MSLAGCDAACGCGFTGSYASQAMADRAMRVHSCEKWVEKIAGQQRRAARLASVDRTPKPCLHKTADHHHGTRACYVLDRCRCLPCAEANSASERERERQKAYGRYDKFVDAAPVRDHVRGLMAQGMGLKRIAKAAGIGTGTASKLIYGVYAFSGNGGGRNGPGLKTRQPSTRVLRTTADRLLAVTLDLGDGAVVDHTGTTRRLQALVALGWSQRRLAGRLGINLTNLTPLVHGKRQVVVATARDVAALYDELSMTLPPQDHHRDKIAASRARNLARGYGWLPPLAWDDDLIDDPAHTPLLERDRALAHVREVDEAAIYRRMHGDKTVRLSKADAAELVARCRAAQWSWNDIERRTGVKPDRYPKQEAS